MATAAPPGGTGEEVSITGFALGVWTKKRAHTRILSLVIHKATHKFVVLVGNTVARQQARARLCTWAESSRSLS